MTQRHARMSTTETERWIAAVLSRLPAHTPTPAFVFDLQRLRQSAAAVRQLGCDRLMYSTKTCPQAEVVTELRDLGFDYDAATIGEIRLLNGLDVASERIVATHPSMPCEAVIEASRRGIRAFTFDSREQLRRLAAHAPGADWYLRIRPAMAGGLYDYRHRFGVTEAEADHILRLAARRHYPVTGISFHVGTQNGDLDCWEATLTEAAGLMSRHARSLPRLRVLNVGAGFPVRYAGEPQPPDLSQFARLLSCARQQAPPATQIWAEPGRILAADAAVLLTRITGVITRAEQRWISIDASAYTGPVEILHSGRRMRYPVWAVSSPPGTRAVPCTVAGPTLDPEDILAENLLLSERLAEGDVLAIGAVGAYTTQFRCDYHCLDRPEVIVIDTNCSPHAGMIGTMPGLVRAELAADAC